MGLMTLIGKLFGKSNGSGYKGGSGSGSQTLEGTQIVCMECKRSFVFEEGEQKFYKMRGLTPPKRCPSCRRHKRRHHRR